MKLSARSKSDRDSAKTEIVYGRNPVRELLRAGRRHVSRILVAKGAQMPPALQSLLSGANASEIPIEYVERRRLDLLCKGHQGLAAEVTAYTYATIPDMFGRAEDLGEPPLILLLDMIQDPQNLGSLLRTAEAVGVHGAILPPRRAAKVSPAVVRASSGACEHLLVAPANLAQAIGRLKRQGLWVIGLENAEEARFIDEVELKGALGVVVGSEGQGMRRLVRRSCDLLVRLPMRGRIDSLNAAVAGSIMLYAVWQARAYEGRGRKLQDPGAAGVANSPGHLERRRGAFEERSMPREIDH